VAGTAGTTAWHESIPMGMAACAGTTDKVAMVTTIIICVVIIFCVAGLADPVPRLILLIEGIVGRSCLKYCKLKGAINMPWFFSNKL
jgi:hypothetical protein